MNYRGIPNHLRNEHNFVYPPYYSGETTHRPPHPEGLQYEYYQTPFEQYAKPEQPMNWYMPQNQFDNQFYQEPPQQNQQSSFVNPFQAENGQLDFNKIMSTVSQLANTVQQVSPVIKQVGAMIKTFR